MRRLTAAVLCVAALAGACGGDGGGEPSADDAAACLEERGFVVERPTLEVVESVFPGATAAIFAGGSDGAPDEVAVVFHTDERDADDLVTEHRELYAEDVPRVEEHFYAVGEVAVMFDPEANADGRDEIDRCLAA